MLLNPCFPVARAIRNFDGYKEIEIKIRYPLMTKASDLFIECLEAEGCEYVFGIPGEENLDFLDSLSRSSKIKLILTRHEQGLSLIHI